MVSSNTSRTVSVSVVVRETVAILRVTVAEIVSVTGKVLSSVRNSVSVSVSVMVTNVASIEMEKLSVIEAVEDTVMVTGGLGVVVTSPAPMVTKLVCKMIVSVMVPEKDIEESISVLVAPGKDSVAKKVSVAPTSKVNESPIRDEVKPSKLYGTIGVVVRNVVTGEVKNSLSVIVCILKPTLDVVTVTSVMVKVSVTKVSAVAVAVLMVVKA